MLTVSKDAIIGQDRLIDRINSYNIDTFPHSILLEGPVGCGKHTLCYAIGDALGLEVVELNSNAERKDVDTIQTKPYPCLYVIDITDVIPKFQNSILKILEEPPAGAFIICLCITRHAVLPTIQNRCVVWTFDRYSKDVLTEFISPSYSAEDREIALSIFNTPGKIIKNQCYSLMPIKSLVLDILNRLGRASVPNVLSIADKIAFKNEKGKIDLFVFMDALLYEAFNKAVNEPSVAKYQRVYQVVSEMNKRVSNCISKQRTFEGYLIKLYEVLNDDTGT